MLTRCARVAVNEDCAVWFVQIFHRPFQVFENDSTSSCFGACIRGPNARFTRPAMKICGTEAAGSRYACVNKKVRNMAELTDQHQSSEWRRIYNTAYLFCSCSATFSYCIE
jgi:hypothetical protein